MRVDKNHKAQSPDTAAEKATNDGRTGSGDRLDRFGRVLVAAATPSLKVAEYMRKSSPAVAQAQDLVIRASARVMVNWTMTAGMGRTPPVSFFFPFF